MAAILILAHGPKSKSIDETVLKISRSQVGRTEGQTDGRTDGRPAFLCPTQTLFAEDKKIVISSFIDEC